MNNVDVKLVVEIPSQAVLYYAAGYGGTFNGGVKCSPHPVIDLDKTGAASLSLPTPAWGMTHAYVDADALLVPGKPDWFRTLRATARPTGSRRLARTADNLNAVFVQLAGASHAVKFTVVGANPFLDFAPAIDAEITVGLRKVGAAVQYRCVGSHDGFPDYKIIIRGRQVYHWDCVAQKQDPSDLAPDMDVDVNIPWAAL